MTFYAIIIAATLGASCPEPEVVIVDGEITKKVLEQVEEAKRGCKRNFGEDSCLVKLIRKNDHYVAICQTVAAEKKKKEVDSGTD